jgi:hypothetical protein
VYSLFLLPHAETDAIMSQWQAMVIVDPELAIEFGQARCLVGKNIDEILDLTVHQAIEFFAREFKIVRALMPLAELGTGIGTGLGNIDKVNIVDLGGGAGGDGKGAVAKFAMTVPDVLFGVLAKMKTLGLDIDGLLKKLGVDPSHLNELLAAQPAAEPPLQPVRKVKGEEK